MDFRFGIFDLGFADKAINPKAQSKILLILSILPNRANIKGRHPKLTLDSCPTKNIKHSHLAPTQTSEPA
jgi:hypothetical protein